MEFQSALTRTHDYKHFKNQLHAQSHAYIELIARGFVFMKKRHHVLDSTLHLFGGSLSVTQLDLF